MRSLIFAFLLINAPASFGFYQTAGVSYIQNSNTSFQNATEIETGSITTTSLSYGLFDWKRYHSFNVNYQQRFLPYEKMKILNSEAELEPLSNRFADRPEHWVSFGHDFSMGSWNISTSIGTPIGNVPYSRQTAGVNIRYSLTDRTTLLVGSEYQQLKRPESYGTLSATNETVKLMEKVNFSRFVLGAEQIVAPRIKMSVTGETAVYEDERPRHFGYTAKVATAPMVSPINIFLKGGHSFRKESTSEVLNTVGGYLEYRSTFVEATVEPVYDLLVSTSYQLTSEKQNEQAVGRLTQIAYDQFGMAVSYDWDNMKTTIKGSYLMPNQFENQLNMEGGVEWTF